MAAQLGGAIHIPETAAGEPVRWRLALVGLLTLAALVWSGYLATVSLGWVELGLCSSGSCSQLVLSSPWARWLSVPVSILSMGLYLAVLCVLPLATSANAGRRRVAWSALVAMAFIIVGAAIWFVGLMALNLRKSCGHCASMHMLGMVIAYFLITMAPMGQQPAALRPRRVLGLAAIALAGLLLLVGGQVLHAIAVQTQDTGAATEDIQSAATDSQTSSAPSDADQAQPAVVGDDSACAPWPDANTPEGKEATVARLKREHGDRWNRPSTLEHLLPYYAARPSVLRAESGFYYEVLKNGSGRSPRSQDRVRVHFRGKLWTGPVFHDTLASGRPQDVPVTEMIPGLAEALPMMTEGSRWRVLLPSHLAYGATGLPGVVPPSTAVFYEVELLEVLPPSQQADSSSPTQAALHQEPQ